MITAIKVCTFYPPFFFFFLRFFMEMRLLVSLESEIIQFPPSSITLFNSSSSLLLCGDASSALRIRKNQIPTTMIFFFLFLHFITPVYYKDRSTFILTNYFKFATTNLISSQPISSPAVSLIRVNLSAPTFLTAFLIRFCICELTNLLISISFPCSIKKHKC